MTTLSTIALQLFLSAAVLRRDHQRYRRRRAEAKAFVAEMDRDMAEIDAMLAELEASHGDEHDADGDRDSGYEGFLSEPDWR